MEIWFALSLTINPFKSCNIANKVLNYPPISLSTCLRNALGEIPSYRLKYLPIYDWSGNPILLAISCIDSCVLCKSTFISSSEKLSIIFFAEAPTILWHMFDRYLQEIQEKRTAEDNI